MLVVAVVAIAHQHRPASAAESGNHRLPDELAHVGIRKLPENIVATELVGVGHVKCIDLPATTAQRADEHRLPACLAARCVPIDITDDQRPVVDETVRIQRRFQAEHCRQGRARNIGELLHTGSGSERMQHPVIRRHIDDLAPLSHRGTMGLIGRRSRPGESFVREILRCSDKYRRRVNDVAKHCKTVPEGAAVRHFPRLITPQVVEHGAVVPELRLLRGAQIGPFERDTVRSRARIDVAARRCHLGQLGGSLPCRRRRDASVRHRIGPDVTGPHFAGEARLEHVGPFLQFTRRHAQIRRRCRALNDAVERTLEPCREFLRRRGADELAASIDCRVPQVILLSLVARCTRPADLARRQSGQVNHRIQRPLQAERDTEGHHVLVTGRIEVARRHLVRIGPEVSLVVVHRDVGKCPRSGIRIRSPLIAVCIADA